MLNGLPAIKECLAAYDSEGLVPMLSHDLRAGDRFQIPYGHESEGGAGIVLRRPVIGETDLLRCKAESCRDPVVVSGRARKLG